MEKCKSGELFSLNRIIADPGCIFSSITKSVYTIIENPYFYIRCSFCFIYSLCALGLSYYPKNKDRHVEGIELTQLTKNKTSKKRNKILGRL